MGVVDGAAVRMMVVGFGRGSAFVFRPSDVVVEELVVRCSHCTFALAGLEATEGLEFERAGNWRCDRVGEIMGEGSDVGWVCSILW